MRFLRGVAGPLVILGLAALTLGSSPVRADSTGLVAAYGFEETSGVAAVDSSGSGNTGTLAGPVSSALGRFGRALSFDGANDLVNIADASSLDLTSAMTLEAWVKPEGTGWQTVLLKERPGGLAYAAYSSTDTGTPSGEVRTSSSAETRSGSVLPFATWSHLATTYDGATLRLYVNGAQVSSRALSGSIEVGTGALRIGGNLVWGEYFRGLIDEVRVYQRALSATEIQADMGTAVVPVVPTDPQPPTAPGGLTAAVAQDDVHLSWSAATDNVGVTGYRLYRSASSGFTPGTGTLVATLGAAAVSYDDQDRPPGTSYYKVVAFDAAGNASAPSAEASAAVTVDLQAPTAPGGLAAAVVDDTVTLTWLASSDNVGVAGYRVYRGSNPGYTPGPGFLYATLGVTTTFVDANRIPGPQYYRVLAFDAAGNVSPSSTEVLGNVVDTDTQPPTAPTDLTASVSGDQVHLSWTASTDNKVVDKYRVYRGTTPGFPTSGDFSMIDGNVTTFVDDVGEASGTFYYKVIALDLSGNQSPPSNEVSATLEPDVTPPTASVVDAACDGVTPIQEYIYVYLNVVDDRSPVNVRVLVDDVLAQQFTTAPGPHIRFEWSTRNRYSNGVHAMTIEVTDSSGNESVSEPCLWNVQNPVLSVSIPTPAAGSVVSGVTPLSVLPQADGQPVNGWPARVTILVDGATIAQLWTAPFQLPWDTTGLANGVHTITANLYWLDYASVQATSTIQVSVDNSVPQPPSGLVAAYGFDEAVGTSVTDSSGTGNTGTISGATRSASGKYGGALSFDGLNDLVSIADSGSLDLTTGMTLEAWVRPTAINNWRTVLFKERPGGLAYGLYAGTDTSRPGGFVDIGGERSARATTALPLNTWTHVAATYDGVNLRFYVNGTQAGVLALTGAIPATSGQLKIGGNSVWSEWFKGLIDEVRVYNRALTAAEIAADRDRPVAN